MEKELLTIGKEAIKKIVSEADARGHKNASIGAGASGGVGALIGSFIGPIGAIVGGCVGSLGGFLIGKAQDEKGDSK